MSPGQIGGGGATPPRPGFPVFYPAALHARASRSNRSAITLW